MSEFPRLLRSGSPVQRAMLQAAKGDAPTASSQERLLLALGLGGVAMSIGSAAHASSHVDTASSPITSPSISIPMQSGIGATAASAGLPSLAAPAAAAMAVPTTSTSTAFVAKLFIVATLSMTAVGIVGVRFINRTTPASQVTAQETSLARAASPDAIQTDSATTPTLLTPPPVSDLGPGSPEVRATPRSVASRRSVIRQIAVEPMSVSEETALVGKARGTLRHGDPAGCLSLLEIRRKGVRGGGVLAPEAAVLRIEALRALGQREQATKESVVFVHDYPGSPLVDRIRGLLDAADP